MSTLTFVTGNAAKLKETREILKQVAPNITLVSYDCDLTEIQGASVAEVARAKAIEAANKVKGAVLIEDFGLCVRAMGDFPGPYIKWFMNKLGQDGLWKMIEQFHDRTAETVSVFAFCSEPGATPILFEGRCSGKIVSPRGIAKFGPDALFQPDGANKTFAEMSVEEKHSMSHRFKALDMLRKELPHIILSKSAAN